MSTVVTVLVLAFWVVVVYALDRRLSRPADQRRPGRLERRPNGSQLGPWGPEPRVGEVKRLYYGIRRAQRLTGSKHPLPRRPHL